MFLNAKFCAVLILLEITNAMFFEQELLDSLLYNSTYDKRIPPGRDRTDSSFGTPTVITVSMYISDIFEVDEAHMDFSLTMFFRQSWIDHRLKFNNQDFVLQLGNDDINNVWTPDTFISELKTGYQHDVLKTNALMHIFPNGTVLYSMRLTTKVSCLMEFHMYPLDRQKCKVGIGSYGLSSYYVVYEWIGDNPITIETISLPLYTVSNEILSKTRISYYEGFVDGYSTLEATIDFRRSIGYYLIELFIPDILIIILSWVSFWLHPDAVPARVSLGCVTVLTISSQSSASRAHAPRVSYVKASDIWTLFQTLFVFAAMVEYSIVNVLARKKRPDTKLSKKTLHITDIISTGSANGDNVVSKDHRPYCQRAKRIDMISRFAFPVAYIIFNGVFWTIISKVE